jgi:hypothetical protein
MLYAAISYDVYKHRMGSSMLTRRSSFDGFAVSFLESMTACWNSGLRVTSIFRYLRRIQEMPGLRRE